MEKNIDTPQILAVVNFMMFLSDTLTRTAQHFEEEVSCSPEEVNVIRILSIRGPLIVKEIAQDLPGIDPSKLTRLLNTLEKQNYIKRTLNTEDRRSLIITPTERGKLLLQEFTDHLNILARGMLTSLSPAERMMLVELFGKIEANWGSTDKQIE